MMSGRCVGLSLAALLWVTAASAAILTVSEDVAAPCGRAGDAYVVARGARWISTNVSVETVRTVQKRLSGDFLWARCAGKEYLVRDARPIEQAEALFAPLRKLEPEQSALSRRQSKLEAAQAELDKEQEEIERSLDRAGDDSRSHDDALTRRRLESRQSQIHERLRALEKEERELDAIERSIDQREEEIEAKAERELWRLIDRTIANGLARPAR
jgi:hypothetical protein